MSHQFRSWHFWRWIGVGLVVLVGLGLLARLGWSWYQRSRGLAGLTAMTELTPAPTLPLKFDQFKIDNTPLRSSLPTATTSTSALDNKTTGIGLLTTSAAARNYKPLATPTTLNPLNSAAQLSIPYIKGFDLLLNQDGQEIIVLRGKKAEGSMPTVTYAYPLISPNGKLVAFFEWFQPKIKNQLATADLAVLKILDIATGKIRTTNYQFVDLTHDVDGGLPVKWNARNYLEIEQHTTQLKIAHILYDPDRDVVMAENNLNLVAKTPWPQLAASEILRGFSVSPDGQWRVITNDKQFLLLPVGSTKQLPIELSEVTDGQLVRLFSWYGSEVWFEVEKKPYQGCVGKAAAAKTLETRDAGLTDCFRENHYLIAVDAANQQVKRRWYNYQIGESDQWRWIRLPMFLEQATLNQRNEIIYFESHVPLVYATDVRVRLLSAFDNKRALVISANQAELVDQAGQKTILTLESPVTKEMVYRSSYAQAWIGNDRYVVLYASGYDEASAQRVLVVDADQKTIRLINSGGSLFTSP